MNTISELNTFGSLTLNVTDERPSKVIFDRVYPLGPVEQSIQITSTTVNPNPGINIVEVINYATANVRYQISIRTSGSPLLTGSTISWASLPSGVVLTTVGSTYTLTGINTAAIWQQIKNFTWNLPVNYASCPNWSLDVSIIYYDSELGQDVSADWIVYDPDTYYFAELSSSSSLTCIGQDARLVSASLTCVSALALEPKLLEGIINTIQASFSISCQARLRPKDGEFFSTTSLTAQGGYYLGTLRSNIFSTSSVSCNLTGVITNLISRSYVSNSENNIFVTDTPNIDDADPATTATFSISLSATNGSWASSSTSTYSNPFTFSGTRSQVNNLFSQIKFYPTSGTTSNGTVTYVQQKDGVTQVTRTFAMNYGSAGSAYVSKYFVFTRESTGFVKPTGVTYPSNYIFVTGSNYEWTPTNYDIIYSSTKHILLIGAGGQGADGTSFSSGGGGGAGGYYQFINYPWASGTHYVSPGIIPWSGGGQAASRTDVSGSSYSTIYASNGGDASGSTGGYGSTYPGGPTYSGGTGTYSGGGGAGSAVNGTNSSYPNIPGSGGQGAALTAVNSVFHNIPLPDLFGSSLNDPAPGYVTLNSFGRFGGGGGAGAETADLVGANGGSAGGGQGGGTNFSQATAGKNGGLFGAGAGGGGKVNSAYPNAAFEQGGLGAPGLVIFYFA